MQHQEDTVIQRQDT